MTDEFGNPLPGYPGYGDYFNPSNDRRKGSSGKKNQSPTGRSGNPSGFNLMGSDASFMSPNTRANSLGK